MRIAEIAGAGEVAVAFHQQFEPVEQIVDIAEGAGLRAVSIDCDRLVAQRLHDEVGHHATVVLQHARAIGVEDARDLDFHVEKTAIVAE